MARFKETTDFAIESLSELPGVQADLEAMVEYRRQVLSHLIGTFEEVSVRCLEFKGKTVPEAIEAVRLSRDPLARLRKNNFSW